MVGQPLQHVAHIDHHAAWRRIDRQPTPLPGQDLEPRLLGS